MSKCQIYLILGDDCPDDLQSFAERGYKVAEYNFSIGKDVDATGKVVEGTEVKTSLSVVLPQVPDNNIIEWEVNPEKRYNGAVIALDENDAPVEKILFKDAACQKMRINFSRERGTCCTELAIGSENIDVEFGKKA
jgi:hypothetical protein